MCACSIWHTRNSPRAEPTGGPSSVILQSSFVPTVNRSCQSFHPWQTHGRNLQQLHYQQKIFHLRCWHFLTSVIVKSHSPKATKYKRTTEASVADKHNYSVQGQELPLNVFWGQVYTKIDCESVWTLPLPHQAVFCLAVDKNLFLCLYFQCFHVLRFSVSLKCVILTWTFFFNSNLTINLLIGASWVHMFTVSKLLIYLDLFLPTSLLNSTSPFFLVPDFFLSILI